MGRSKKSLNVIKDLVAFLEWLKAAEVKEKILTPYGDGLLEGLVTSDPKFTPEFVSKEEYNEVCEDNARLHSEIAELKEIIYKKNKHIDKLERSSWWF